MTLRNIVCAFLASVLALSSAFGQQIQAGKSLQVMIAGVPPEEKGRIDGMYPVSDSGTINMPFIGTVRAVGLRNEDLAASLQSRYKSEGIYTNPTIQVISTFEGATVNKQSVTVGGQVRRPGPVDYTQGMTLWMAVQAAGGATEFGAKNRVRLFRGGSQKSYDMNQAQFMRVPLQADDTIDVPEKNIFGK